MGWFMWFYLMNEEVNQASELQISSMISKNNNIAAETRFPQQQMHVSCLSFLNEGTKPLRLKYAAKTHLARHRRMLWLELNKELPINQASPLSTRLECVF